MDRSPAPRISGSARRRVWIGASGLVALLAVGFSRHELAGADPVGTSTRADRSGQIIVGP